MSVSKVQWLELSQLSLCSEFDKENSMEFLLNSLLLIHFTTVAMCLLSHGPHVTLVMWHTVTVTCDVTSITPLWHCDKVTWYFPVLHLVVVSPIRKKNINNDLAILPSHDKEYFCSFYALKYFIRITKQWYNKRKETKKTSKFPKIVKVK